MSKRKGYVYVIQLDDGSVYVGSTFKPMVERIGDNFVRKDGMHIPPDMAKEIGEDRGWKYGSPGAKLIRQKYKRYSTSIWPDIDITDRATLEEWEEKCCNFLKGCGLTVHGDKA